MAARSRTTPYAVLGMLHLRPMSGYDIRKEAETSLGYFWSESYGQLYPALRDLAAAGLIRRRAGGRTGTRERQVYEITASGREALALWRTQPPRPTPVRSELLLKLFFGDRASAGPELDWVDDVLATETEALKDFRRIRSELRRQGDHPSLPFWLITLGYGEHRSRAAIRWCRETRKALHAMVRGAGRKDTRR
jgi:DNA-binding PadR family transcriptional regulator